MKKSVVTLPENPGILLSLCLEESILLKTSAWLIWLRRKLRDGNLMSQVSIKLAVMHVCDCLKEIKPTKSVIAGMEAFSVPAGVI